jgi:hypothetical protein
LNEIAICSLFNKHESENNGTWVLVGVVEEVGTNDEVEWGTGRWLLLLLPKTHANNSSDVIITAPQELDHFHAPLRTHIIVDKCNYE